MTGRVTAGDGIPGSFSCARVYEKDMEHPSPPVTFSRIETQTEYQAHERNRDAGS